jgi:hypothetical protein
MLKFKTNKTFTKWPKKIKRIRSIEKKIYDKLVLKNKIKNK